MAQAETSVERSRLDLTHATITSPLDGFVTERTAVAGMYVSPGTPLMTIVPSDVFVTANFKETQVGGMRPGQPVEIRIDAYPSRPLKGRIDSLQAGTGSVFSLLPPQNATGNYVKVVQRVPVKIVFAEPVPGDMKLVPGMSVVPRVDVQGETKNASATTSTKLGAESARDDP